MPFLDVLLWRFGEQSYVGSNVDTPCVATHQQPPAGSGADTVLAHGGYDTLSFIFQSTSPEQRIFVFVFVFTLIYF